MFFSRTRSVFADMETLRGAVRLNSNFIVTQEPLFYSHLDKTTSLAGDTVYEEKAKFIKENNLLIFRFHNHIHMTEPELVKQKTAPFSLKKKYSHAPIQNQIKSYLYGFKS